MKASNQNISCAFPAQLQSSVLFLAPSLPLFLSWNVSWTLPWETTMKLICINCMLCGRSVSLSQSERCQRSRHSLPPPLASVISSQSIGFDCKSPLNHFNCGTWALLIVKWCHYPRLIFSFFSNSKLLCLTLQQVHQRVIRNCQLKCNEVAERQEIKLNLP